MPCENFDECARENRDRNAVERLRVWEKFLSPRAWGTLFSCRYRHPEASGVLKGIGGDSRERARALLAVVVIVLLSTALRPEAIPQWFAQQDKVHHLIGFFVLAWALSGAFPRLGFAAVLAIGAAGALAIELAQVVLPMRTASLLDAGAGIAGVLLGRAAAVWARRRSNALESA